MRMARWRSRQNGNTRRPVIPSDITQTLHHPQIHVANVCHHRQIARALQDMNQQPFAGFNAQIRKPAGASQRHDAGNARTQQEIEMAIQQVQIDLPGGPQRRPERAYNTVIGRGRDHLIGCRFLSVPSLSINPRFRKTKHRQSSIGTVMLSA